MGLPHDIGALGGKDASEIILWGLFFYNHYGLGLKTLSIVIEKKLSSKPYLLLSLVAS